jgi:hypothetical protein
MAAFSLLAYRVRFNLILDWPTDVQKKAPADATRGHELILRLL